jgi:hypothetical protein
MALEKPEIGVDVEFGFDLALTVAAAIRVDARNAIEHQHGRQRLFAILHPEKFAVPATDEFFVIV